MMVLLFREFSDSVGEGQRIDEVLELVLAFQLVIADDLPIPSELGSELCNGLARERWLASLPEVAALRSQIAHVCSQ